MTSPQATVLTDPASAMTATFVPGAGMICTSLSDDGVELLGQRRGLEAYLSDGKTMGIPFLYPWANRLSTNGYGAFGHDVTLTPGVGGVRADANGFPMHGVLGAYPGWEVTEHSDNRIEANIDFSSRPTLLASFPFPHVVRLSITLADRALTVRTTVTAIDAPVPLCFGFHPYFTIPDVPRSQWRLETPTMRHLLVDEMGLPTGSAESWPAMSEALADKTFDDGFDEVLDGAVFAISGGDRRIEIEFERGYRAAQIFAPGNDPVIAIEPMAAPTNALRTADYDVAAPGEPARASFTIRV